MRKREHDQSGVLADVHIQSWAGSACTYKTWLQVMSPLFNHVSHLCYSCKKPISIYPAFLPSNILYPGVSSTLRRTEKLLKSQSQRYFLSEGAGKQFIKFYGNWLQVLTNPDAFFKNMTCSIYSKNLCWRATLFISISKNQAAQGRSAFHFQCAMVVSFSAREQDSKQQGFPLDWLFHNW